MASYRKIINYQERKRKYNLSLKEIMDSVTSDFDAVALEISPINLFFQAVCTTFAAVNIQRSIYGRLSGGKYDVIKPRFAISQLDGGVEC